ncbi:MAG: hypothetical protein WD023_08410 [Ilumatobacteraceae bacterium]
MGAISTWEPDTVEALLDMRDLNGAAPAALRRFRFPHFAAAGLLYGLTGDWSDFATLTVNDISPEDSSIQIGGTVIAVPLESWRFLRVQEVHSRRAGKRAASRDRLQHPQDSEHRSLAHLTGPFIRECLFGSDSR